MNSSKHHVTSREGRDHVKGNRRRKKRHSLATCEKSTRENELAFTWDCDEQSKWGGRAGGNHVKRYFVEKLREK